MSNRERCNALLDGFTDAQLVNVAAVLQAMKQTIADAAGEAPNAETLAALDELENGGGVLFTGSTADLFAQLGGEG